MNMFRWVLVNLVFTDRADDVQDNFEEIDDATMAQILEAYNKEQTDNEQQMAEDGAQQSSYIDPKLWSSWPYIIAYSGVCTFCE